VRRLLVAVLLALLALGALYQLRLRERTESGELVASRAVATIGAGEEAVGVGADGTILRWLPPSTLVALPQLPLASAPEKRQLAGPLRRQVRVLAAAPPVLRPHLAGSYYGESGIDVELRSGIELRFGSASQAARKWRAAAAVLADPSVSALDYVDLHAPSRPAIGGSGHTLPPPG
jgi:hypothetical protein